MVEQRAGVQPPTPNNSKTANTFITGGFQAVSEKAILHQRLT